MYFFLNKINLALADYKKAVEINPVYVHPYLNLAAYYEYVKDYKQALVYYDKILALDAQNDGVIVKKKLILEKMKTM